MIKLYLTTKIQSQIRHLANKEYYLTTWLIETLEMMRNNPQHRLLATIKISEEEIYACYFAKRWCLTFYRKHSKIYLLELYNTTNS